MSDLARITRRRAVFDRAAAIITDLSAPAAVVIVTFIVVTLNTTNSIPEALAVLATAIIPTVAIPMIYLWWLIQKRSVSDRHVLVRRQRLPLLLVGLGGSTIALGALAATDAPRDVFALTIADIVGLASVLVFTHRWKVSMHTAVAGGAVAVLVQVFGWNAAWLVCVMPLIGWSRIRLSHHTTFETLVGATLGVAVGAIAFALAS